MHPGALLQLTSSLLQAVLRLDQPADRVVSAFFKTHRALGPRERHTLAETAYAVLRRRLQLQHLAQSGTGPLERRLAQLAWQGDRDFLRRGTTLEENAWLDQVQHIDPATLADKLRHNLPDWVATPLKESLGAEGFWALVGALDGIAPLDLRVNVLKTRREDAMAGLAGEGVVAEPTPSSPWGLRVQGKPALNRVPAFVNGDVEVQDEGSQLLGLLLGARRGERVGDLCAGAGGKTLLLASQMRDSGQVYAMDVSEKRLAQLSPRLKRAGMSNVQPQRIESEDDPRLDKLAGKLDRVLVDAPCSGLGTLRRNPDLKFRQSETALDELTAKQARILAAAARLVKPGGALLYGTCSPLVEENRQIVDGFLATHPDFSIEHAGPALAKACPDLPADLAAAETLQLSPQEHGTDAFFGVRLIRISS